MLIFINRNSIKHMGLNIISSRARIHALIKIRCKKTRNRIPQIVSLNNAG